jgi:hypothetical protein
MAKSSPKKPALRPAGSKPSGARPGATPRPTLSFSRVNAMWLGAGAVAIAAGYGLLSAGSTTLAPVLLVAGYCVLLPIGIIKR